MSLPALGRGGLGDKSPVFSRIGFFSGVPWRAWLAPALAPPLPGRLGCVLCCGQGWVGALGLLWVARVWRVALWLGCTLDVRWGRRGISGLPEVFGGASLCRGWEGKWPGGQEVPAHPRMNCW